ncbi:hypothetical protein AC579_823 [Pseudocercospora musae]|uniref:Uncharacterized protein n=1 Tax=Pseudocercospora musae TaxID=113226 RepID=A0A139IBW2_9PEZI|nr:hypothetical protein AC579_823 [Pseudocercospora musae]
MAVGTNSVVFAVPKPATHENPYMVARQSPSLDHITGGRCAWDIVTSLPNSSAQVIGHDTMMPRDERQAKIDEFMDVVFITARSKSHPTKPSPA